jgi:alpha/beta superfamily hydrolase
MSIINWEVVKPALWTGVGGVVVGMFLLSYGFGFMSRTAAEKMANTNSEKAVVAVLAPVCADKFRALPDVGARTATLVADKDDFYKMREAFPEAMITLPDKSYPDSDLTAACAALILAPPKTADLKQ